MRISTLLTVVILLFALNPVSAADLKEIEIGSATTVGVYYAEASAFAKVFNRKSREYGVKLYNVASQGSEENIDNVVNGKVEFGIAQADMLYYALNGRKLWVGNQQESLRAIMELHTEAMTIVIAEDARVGDVAGLKGKRVNVGAIGSSDEELATEILHWAGLKEDLVDIVRYPAAIASDLLTEGKIDAYFFTVGHPNLSIKEALFGKRKVSILSLDDKMIKAFTTSSSVVRGVEINTDYYDGLDNKGPIKAIGVKAVLFTRADVDEETVYRLTKEIMTNLPTIHKQHPVLGTLKAKEMAVETVVPLHPGAKKYFREAGFMK